MHRAGRCCLDRLAAIQTELAPAGVLLSQQELQEAADVCAEASAYLVVDNTYEDFVYEQRQHHCVSAPHVLHIFSMSKVGLMPSPGMLF